MDRIEAEKIIGNNRSVYNTIAHFFSGTRNFLWQDLKPLKRFAQPGDDILDVGCGNGRLYQMFADLSIRYTGIDQSEELIQIAKEKFPQAQFFVSGMGKLSFSDASFDLVYCIAAFHHLPTEEHRQEALREMHRVLKPGGKLLMTNWNLLGEFGKKQIEKGKYQKEGDRGFLVPWTEKKEAGNRWYYAFTLPELVQLFSDAGFEIEEQYYSKGESKSDQEKGENIISIVKKV